MSQSRQYLPGSTYTYTRRTCLGTCRFVPEPLINAVFFFAVAIAAFMTNVSIHAFVVMPNHIHMVLTDNAETARLPDFLRIFHSLVARALIRIQEEPGPVWDSRGPDIKRIEGPETILRKIVYVLANPAAAHLCRDPERWYGAISPIAAMGGEPIDCPRPRRFAAKVTAMAKSHRLRLTIPAAFGDISAEDYQALVRRRLQARVADITERRRRRGGRILARSIVEKRDIFARPTEHPSTKRRDQTGRRSLFRHLECDAELYEELALALIGFRRAYREAYDRWRSGEHDVEFPCGTWAVGRYHGARVAGRA